MKTNTAVVTGAASGLGLEVVRQLVARGGRVIGVDLDGDERRAAVEGAGAEFVACDVTSLQEWDNLVTALEEREDLIDLLVLNAGVMTRRPPDPIDDDPLELARSAGYRRVLGVNIDGVVFGVVATRRRLADGARVVVTASEAGLVPNPFDPFYTLSKHGLVGFVRAAAPTLHREGVVISAICPGGIDTALVPEQIRARVDPARLRPPADIARSLLAVAERDEPGGVWIPGPDGSIVQHEWTDG
jgi:NAD(P)-dependent dehydrogenase (short-subunit alcohol dehydrogenase family)